MFAREVNDTVCYDNPHNGQKYTLMINHMVQISGLPNHLSCPMQCWLNGVQIDEVPKFLADSPSKTAYAIQIRDHINAAHMLIIPYIYKLLPAILICSPQGLQNMRKKRFKHSSHYRRATLGPINR